jgi:hypothetical protein
MLNVRNFFRVSSSQFLGADMNLSDAEYAAQKNASSPGKHSPYPWDLHCFCNMHRGFFSGTVDCDI